MVAERYGSVTPTDYSDESTRETLKTLIKEAEKPFDFEEEKEPWKSWTVQPV